MQKKCNPLPRPHISFSTRSMSFATADCFFGGRFPKSFGSWDPSPGAPALLAPSAPPLLALSVAFVLAPTASSSHRSGMASAPPSCSELRVLGWARPGG